MQRQAPHGAVEVRGGELRALRGAAREAPDQVREVRVAHEARGQRRRHVPERQQLAVLRDGLADLSAMFGGQLALGLEMLDNALPPQMRFGFSVRATQEWLDRLLPLVVEHELETIVTMTGYDDSLWRLRLLW